MKDEQIEYITKILECFDIELDSAFKQKLNEDENIRYPAYFDEPLLKKLPELFSDNKIGFSLKESKKYRCLISLCFKGDVSNRVWDEIWKYLSVEESLYYASTQYYLGFPLEIAAKNNNLAALKRLDSIYKTLLEKFPKYKSEVHWALRSALQECYIDQDNTQCYEFLLSMVDKYSTLNNKKIKNLRERFLCYKLTGIHSLKSETTAVLDMYIDVAKTYLNSSNYQHIDFLCDRLISKGMSLEEFLIFEKKLVQFLNEKSVGFLYDRLSKKGMSLEDLSLFKQALILFLENESIDLTIDSLIRFLSPYKQRFQSKATKILEDEIEQTQRNKDAVPAKDVSKEKECPMDIGEEPAFPEEIDEKLEFIMNMNKKLRCLVDILSPYAEKAQLNSEQTEKAHKSENISIPKTKLEKILNNYKSTSFLGYLSSFCFFSPFISSQRSETIIALNLLLMSKEENISRQQIIAAIGTDRDAKRRLSLFNKEGQVENNGTSTDDVIRQLQSAFS